MTTLHHKFEKELEDILKNEDALKIFNEISEKLTETNYDIVKILFILGKQK